MRIIIIIIALGVLISLFVNAGIKILFWFRPFLSGVSPQIFGIIYGILVTAILVLFVLSRIPDSRIPREVFLVDHYALGVVIYVMLFVNFANLILFLLKVCHLLPTPVPQGAAFAAGAAALVLTVVLSVYGGIHASIIQTENYEIELQTAEVEADSMKIALISDLHIGYAIDERHVEKIVAAVNKAEPDLVCIAGDIFDGDITSVKEPKVLEELFHKIKAPYGVYACLGNHDAGAGYEEMLKFLDRAQIHLLEDEEVLIDHKFILAGRKDSGPIGGQGEKRTALKDLAEADQFPRIVLDHRPENIDGYSNSTDLILCGHTHQGQMFPFNLVTRAAFKVDYGFYRQGKDFSQTIVTSGVGTWGPPLRVGTNNEVALIQVTFSTPPAY